MSDESPVISVRQVGKTYRIWNDSASRLVSPIQRGIARALPGGLGSRMEKAASSHYRDFHALRGVNFDVRAGESVGIVGRNGSGNRRCSRS